MRKVSVVRSAVSVSPEMKWLGYAEPLTWIDETYGVDGDDGYADFAVYTLPILQRYGFTATVFPVAGRLGQDNA
jgi:hypothetical protein